MTKTRLEDAVRLSIREALAEVGLEKIRRSEFFGARQPKEERLPKAA